MLKLDYTELNKKSVMGSQAELHIIEFYQPGKIFVNLFSRTTPCVCTFYSISSIYVLALHKVQNIGKHEIKTLDKK